MPRKKQEDYITIQEAAEIVSRNNGREITTAYLRKLASDGKIDTEPLDSRTKLYNRRQAEALRVPQRQKRESKLI